MRLRSRRGGPAGAGAAIAANSVGACSIARDATGREIRPGVVEPRGGNSSIRVFETRWRCRSIWRRLVRGRDVHDSDACRPRCVRGETLIATGGDGHLFRETTNPFVASGDGMAMRSWLALAGRLEFVQFHPTVLSVAGTRDLLSEALRGEGGR